MGCSPSKGTTLGSLGAIRKGRMLPPVPQETKLDEDEGKNVTGSAKGDSKEDKESPHVQVPQNEAQMTPQKKKYVTEEVNTEAMNIDKVESMAKENVTLPLRKEKNIDKQESADKNLGRKQKKAAKGVKGSKRKDKEKNKMSTDPKVDFPEPLVKAHQAAYAFLNPSINKYDSVLALMEQATQTQISVQPMVAFMVLRYEEVIQGLEEMVVEGERVLKENGEHLAWPSQMKNLSSSTQKSGPASTESQPDLLQQLLQYTTQRMRNVSQTVGGIGDSALEEAVDYFASVSELLEEKLKIKRAVEATLMRLLTRIEMASMRMPGAEDSALFSEDSGIGAENESLNGCDKRHRPESCGSTGTNRTPLSPTEYTSMNISGASREKYKTQISPSVSLTSLNSLDSTCTIMPNDQRDSLLGSVSLDDGEDDNNEEEEGEKGVGVGKVAFRLRSNSSPLSFEAPPLRLPTKRIENPQNVEMTLKMKNAISGRIQFVQKQNTCATAKAADPLKTTRRDWADEEVQSSRRPQTAAAVRRTEIKKNPVARGQRSRSAESLRSKGEDPTLFELERTQKALNQRLQRMSESKVGRNSRSVTFKQVQGNSPARSPAKNQKRPAQGRNCNSQPPKDQATLSRCSNKREKPLNVEGDKQEGKITPKCPIKATPPPSPPLSPQPSSGFHRGRNSVKKLIDTFSQGIEVREGPKVLGPLKGVRRCGVPILPGLGNVEAVLSTGVTSCRPEEKIDYLDLESLPPPPLEVLMDTSFESAQSGSTVAGDGATKVGKSPLLKRAAVSQRLRASVQTVTVLPSKGGLPQSSNISTGTSAFSKVSQPDTQPHPEMEMDSLHQQARKILSLRRSSDSNLEKSSLGWGAISKGQGGAPDAQHKGDISVPQPNTSATTVPPSSAACSQPLATPPVSRGRMLPSTPSTPSSLHRRLPSPLSSKKEATPSTESPTVNRRASIQSSLQRRLPSPPVGNQNSSTSYPIKAPSPPASPKVQKLSRENSTEESSSARMFSNARSVFCPVSPSMFEAQPCSVPRPPQAWASTRVSVLSSCWGSRGRFPVSAQGPRPYVRRSQSDRRPSLSLTPRFQGISVAETCGSEPTICSKGLDDDSARHRELWGSQSDLRATPRSASHPDLCIVGQALHRS